MRKHEMQRSSRSNSPPQRKKPTPASQSSSSRQHQAAQPGASNYDERMDPNLSQINFESPKKQYWSETISKETHRNITIDYPRDDDWQKGKQIRHNVINEFNGLSENVKSRFNRGEGNIGFAKYDIDGKKDNILSSFSGPDNAFDGFGSEKYARYVDNKDRKLPAVYIETHMRDVDSEAKIIEQLLSETFPQSEGIIRLYTEISVCDSCGIIIEKFAKERPGIDIEVVQGDT